MPLTRARPAARALLFPLAFLVGWPAGAAAAEGPAGGGPPPQAAGEDEAATPAGEAADPAGERPEEGSSPGKGLAPLGRSVEYPGALARAIKGTGDPATEDPVTHTPYEGYGPPLTKGGFGGGEIAVTNLNDDGAGSLRAALRGPGGAVVVFKVGGTIYPKTTIEFTGQGATVAGETAPAPGITIDGRGIKNRDGETPKAGTPALLVKGRDILLRHIRVRNSPAENISIRAKDVTVDHCSSTGSGDGGIDVDQGSRVVVSWCLIAGCVEASRSHGFKASWHHNFFAANARRHPKIMGKDANPFDFRNNVLASWGAYGIRTEMGASGNIVCNWFGGSGNAVEIGPSAPDWFLSGNFMQGQELNALTRREKPHEEPSVTTLSAEDARGLVAEKAGAFPRDAIDAGYLGGTLTASRAEDGFVEAAPGGTGGKAGESGPAARRGGGPSKTSGSGAGKGKGSGPSAPEGAEGKAENAETPSRRAGGPSKTSGGGPSKGKAPGPSPAEGAERAPN